MKKIIFFIVAVSLAIITVLIVAKFVVVTKVECRLDDQPCSSSEQQLVEQLLGQRLLWQDWLSISRQVLVDQNLEVTAVSLKLPGTLILSLESGQSLYKILDNNSWMMVLGDGSLVPLAEELDLIEVGVTPAQIEIHQLEIVTLLDAISQSKINVSDIRKIELRETAFLIDYNRLELVIPLSRDQSPVAVAKWAVMIDQKLTENLDQPIEQIDFRFNQPVLRTLPDSIL